MQTAEATTAPRPARESSRGGWGERILGVVGALMIAGAVVLLLWGGEGDGGSAPDDVPALAVRQPADGVRVPIGVPVEVVFTSEREIRPMPGGWGTDSLHLHLRVGGVEYMPAAGDIQRLPNGFYRWSFGPLDEGLHVLRLFWSDTQHRPLTEGSSRGVRIVVGELEPEPGM